MIQLHVTTIVSYMAESSKRDTTGLTKDAGWEVGVRTTVPAPIDAVGSCLVGGGIDVWLGTVSLPTERGGRYATKEGTTGEVRTYTGGHRIRLTWQPRGVKHASMLQLTLREAATGTTIAFHHDKLRDRDERWDMLGHWKAVAADLHAHFA